MRICLLLLFFLTIFSCSDKSGTKSVLGPDKMEAVVWDLMRMDELVNEKHQKDSTINKLEESIKLYNQVFQVHNISEQQFKISLKYYKANPHSLKPILDSMQVKANNLSPVFTPSTNE